MPKRKPVITEPEPEAAPNPQTPGVPEVQSVTMQVDPDMVMRRVAMLLLAMSSFHPMELELTGQLMRQNETRAKLAPDVPVEVTQTIGYNARVVAAVAGFQKHLAELERDALRAAQEKSVLRGPLVFPGGRPS